MTSSLYVEPGRSSEHGAPHILAQIDLRRLLDVTFAAGGPLLPSDGLPSPGEPPCYPVPKIVLLPILMLWVGIRDLSKIAIIALACFYPCFINAYYGARTTPTIMV